MTKIPKAALGLKQVSRLHQVMSILNFYFVKIHMPTSVYVKLFSRSAMTQESGADAGISGR